MSRAPAEHEEASQLLPLRRLRHEGSDDSGDDSDNDSDIFAQEDFGGGFGAFDRVPQQKRGSTWTKYLPRLPVPGFLTYSTHKTRQPKVVADPNAPWKLRFSLIIVGSFCFWITSFALALPSYSRPPTHYKELRRRALNSTVPGRVNINNEKVFIAASVYDKDGSLLGGAWGSAVLSLVELLGPANVFVSIYENDASEQAASAMDTFEKRLKCKHSIVNEHLNTDDLQRVVMPDGKHLLKRIAFLARVRNRALAPLDGPNPTVGDIEFDKVLYINDVVFDPIDAGNLLFSTHIGEDGKADYKSACATDFINPFKFYDTFATRDLEGYDLGVPFFPWFTPAGQGGSRADVLAQKDAVRVRSCWGGMVAFQASYFHNTSDSITRGADLARFRAEEDPFWDASECCLIHADIQQTSTYKIGDDAGIYMNPYVRVAYDVRTLSWLKFTRRFERLYTPIHKIANIIGHRPSTNPRRLEEPGQKVKDRVWATNESSGVGAYKDVERIAKPGGFCGNRMLLALPEDGHGGHWYSQAPPPDEGR